MSSAQPIPEPRRKLTVEQYLALERAAQERHEYIDGEIIAIDRDTVSMAGESLPHGIISMNIGTQLNLQLSDLPCVVVTKDTKVRSGLGVVSVGGTSGLFSYPDVLVVCGEPEFFDEHGDVISNPTVIVEVLSPSTESFDRGEKFHRYQTWNPSLQDYLLVDQNKAQAEHYHREKDGKWSYQLHTGLDAVLSIPSIQCTLKLADVYRKVRLTEAAGEMP